MEWIIGPPPSYNSISNNRAPYSPRMGRWRDAAEEIFTAPSVCSLGTFPSCFTTSNSWFPWGKSGQIGKFTCSFSVSRRQCYKPDEFSVYSSFHDLLCLPTGINLKVAVCVLSHLLCLTLVALHPNSEFKFLQDLSLRILSLLGS